MEPHPKSAIVSALPINQSWTLEDTRALYKHYLQVPDFRAPSKDVKADQEWRAGYAAHIESLSMAIGRHVLHLAQTQGISAAPHSQDVDNVFINAWRKAQAGENLSGWDAIAIGRALINPIGLKLVSISPKFSSEQHRPVPTLEQVHDFIQETVSKGSFQSYETELFGGCQNSGLSLTLTLKEWAPSLERFDHEKRQFFHLAAGDIVGPSLQHVTIPVPTGKLLIADWFRHAAFKEITEQVLEGNPSINSASGCEERTRRLAGIGVASVFVSNSCPSILADENGVRVGCLNETGEDLSQGYVCTDLWWATAIDKKILVDLFARSMSAEQAEIEVEKLIAENTNGINEVTVPPGEYHLYYAGDVELFSQLFDRDGVDLSDFEDPMFVLSRSELGPKPAKPTPRV